VKYQWQFEEMKELVLAAKGPEDVRPRVVIGLHKSFPRHMPARRAESCTRPVTGQADGSHQRTGRHGICGAAPASRKTEVVMDVDADARYLAYSLETHSEIVVPVIKGGAVWGEIDIDSDRPDAFGSDDVEFLEAVARLLSERL